MWDTIVTWALTFVTNLAAHNPVVSMILMVLGALVALGQMVIVATPSTADDAWWAKIKALPLIGPILTMLANFAPWQKPAPKS